MTALTESLFTTNRERGARQATFDGECIIGSVGFSLGTGTSEDIYLETGGVKVVVSGFTLDSSSGDFTLELYEGSEATGGTAIQLMNTNRNSSFIPTIVALSTGPTISELGTLIFSEQFAGDNSQNRLTSFYLDIPVILKPNTGYIYRITHQDGQTRFFTARFAAFDSTES